MNNGSRTTTSYNELVELGRRLYDKALVRRESEPITDPRGQAIGWLLDTRMAMLDGELFKDVGTIVAERLRARGIRQVAGFGFGSYALVCSVLSAPISPPFNGGFVRESRKPHGRHRLVEGPLDMEQPVVLLDDIINSGRSATTAVNLLREEGFNVVGMMTLFNFTWSGGKKRLESMDIWVDSVLDLNLRGNHKEE
jgi:orotate phosphoribosyltransferase